MKYNGDVVELGMELDTTGRVNAAVVTNKRIAMDWPASGARFLAVLKSSDGGLTHQGRFGAGQIEPVWTMTATRYVVVKGHSLLSAEWLQAELGKGGCCLFRLPKQHSRQQGKRCRFLLRPRNLAE